MQQKLKLFRFTGELHSIHKARDEMDRYMYS